MLHIEVKQYSTAWQSVKLLSRAGKAKGKYKDSWNVENLDSGEQFYVDLERMEWKLGDVNPLEENIASESEHIPDGDEECYVTDSKARSMDEFAGEAI